MLSPKAYSPADNAVNAPASRVTIGWGEDMARCRSLEPDGRNGGVSGSSRCSEARKSLRESAAVVALPVFSAAQSSRTGEQYALSKG